MRGGYLEAYGGVGVDFVGQFECDDGRTVARGEVAFSWFELPGVLFSQEREAVFFEPFGNLFNRMEGAGALLDEAGQAGIDAIEHV